MCIGVVASVGDEAGSRGHVDVAECLGVVREDGGKAPHSVDQLDRLC